jgi:hypothetical protein
MAPFAVFFSYRLHHARSLTLLGEIFQVTRASKKLFLKEVFVRLLSRSSFTKARGLIGLVFALFQHSVRGHRRLHGARLAVLGAGIGAAAQRTVWEIRPARRGKYLFSFCSTKTLILLQIQRFCSPVFANTKSKCVLFRFY